VKKETVEPITSKPTGTPQSRRRQKKREAKAAKKNRNSSK
jgi:hypothetical protein